jgi:hypothetical protein
MEISSQTFSNLGYLFVHLSDEDVKPIVEEVNELQKNFETATRANDILAGHLNNEYQLFDCKLHIHKLLLPLIYEYKKMFPHFTCRYENYLLDNVWVNFQQKYEFNPVHYHNGIFSFALWLKVPYYIEDENKIFPYINNRENTTANFCFQYTDALGDICRCPIPADKTYENKLVFFPAKMRHSVNPFYTSDEYRISVSGNFS